MDTESPNIVQLVSNLTPSEKIEYEKLVRLEKFNKVLVESAFKLDTVEESAPEWICKNILAGGCMTMLFGDAGAGKTKFAVSLAAWLTHINKGVFYMTTEASFGMQIKGQFLAQNGQAELFHGSTMPCLFNDLVGFGDFMDELGAKVLIVDTLFNYAGSTNTHSDYEVAQMLQPLRQEVFKHPDKAVLVCHHRNKGGNQNELYQISGSGQLAAQFTQVIGLAKVDAESGECQAKVIKSNIGETGLSLKCQIDQMADHKRALMAWTKGSPQHWEYLAED